MAQDQVQVIEGHFQNAQGKYVLVVSRFNSFVVEPRGSTTKLLNLLKYQALMSFHLHVSKLFKLLSQMRLSL